MPPHHQAAHIFVRPHSSHGWRRSHLHPALLRWIAAEYPSSMRLVDVGCGSGRLTLAAAPLAAAVIGLDRDGTALAAGRHRALQTGQTNVRFVETDVEALPYPTLVAPDCIDMVIANLCMSNAIIEHAHAALPTGGCLIFAALHASQWQETGSGSQFAYHAEEMRQVLESTGWRCEAMEIDTEVLHFRGAEDLESYFAESPLPRRWQQNGRWDRLMQYIAAGGERLTIRSHLLVKARKE